MGTVAYRVDRVRFLPENPSSIVPITYSGVGLGAMAVPCLQREQVTVPLSHLISAFHSPKPVSVSVSASVSPNKHRDVVPEHEAAGSEPALNLRDLGLSELKVGQIDQLVEDLLPGFYRGKSISSHWHTSHISAQSFFENKYGHLDMFSALRSTCLFRQHPRTLQRICSDLHYWPVFIQSRGFKTLKSRTRRLQSTSERVAETQNVAPSFVKGFLLRDRGSDVESLDKLMKTKNIPEAHQDAFKTGFAEGFLKAQTLTQKTNDSLRRTRLILFVLLLFGIYGLLKNPFLSVRFRTTTGLDSAVDPVQMKNVTFEHVKGDLSRTPHCVQWRGHRCLLPSVAVRCLPGTLSLFLCTV
ncbi:ATP-dependent zinc metalloprotease YME1L1 isoform X2 [Cavia porcellus]|uniref:ATP-dependent zinc metalloprotease YME1L1 isoform X2 n=1 Tax=Cavia porcellus TaxID=10141 RepID=UPI002FDF6AC3